mmetsp:Transcript_18732/g.52992  ORF Transcript_18732/g.52992 Transcript_18732/m.52992 type:complete len:211 (-) Transcript_18732:151-783(-)
MDRRTCGCSLTSRRALRQPSSRVSGTPFTLTTQSPTCNCRVVSSWASFHCAAGEPGVTSVSCSTPLASANLDGLRPNGSLASLRRSSTRKPPSSGFSGLAGGSLRSPRANSFCSYLARTKRSRWAAASGSIWSPPTSCARGLDQPRGRQASYISAALALPTSATLSTHSSFHVSKVALCTKEMWVPSLRCTPAHWEQIATPRLTLHHRGA